MQARGEGWSGELRHPVALGLGRSIDDLRIEVSRAFTVRGRVLLQGRPIAGEAQVEGGGATAITTGGRFALVGVAPGTHRLQAFLEPRETFFTLGPATIVLVEDGDKTLSFTTDHQPGALLQIDGLPAGKWRVVVRRGLHGAATEAAFEPGKTTELDLELRTADDD